MILDFTANVSHELKTLITAISGYAELIENKMVDEEQGIKFAGEILLDSEVGKGTKITVLI